MERGEESNIWYREPAVDAVLYFVADGCLNVERLTVLLNESGFKTTVKDVSELVQSLAADPWYLDAYPDLKCFQSVPKSPGG